MKNVFKSLLSATLIITLNSCISTTTLEPEPTDNGKTSLVFNLLDDKNEDTRAVNHEGYKLRYVAKLYSGRPTNITQSAEPQRKEIIDGDISELGNKNQLIFDVERGNYYTLFVFADYIPVESQYNSDKGGYEDYFYNTDVDGSRDAIQMLSYPGDKSSIKDTQIVNLSPNFFNNDNYDCFGGVIATDKPKTEEKIELNLQLYRMVSKVRFVDVTKMSGKLDAVVNSFGYLSRFTLDEKEKNPAGWLKVNLNSTYQKILTQKEFSGAEEQEMFYFYTFAPAGSNSNNYPSINFTLSDGVNETKTYNVESIPVKRNQITTVKGYLFPGYVAPEEPGDGPLILNSSLGDSDDTWTDNIYPWSSK